MGSLLLLRRRTIDGLRGFVGSGLHTRNGGLRWNVLYGRAGGLINGVADVLGWMR